MLKNKKEGLNSLAINYQFTHEYKKMEFNDTRIIKYLVKFMMKIKLVSDQSRFIEQENKIILSSDLNKLGVFNLSYSITNWKNNFKIYYEDDLINFIDEDQSNVNLNWFKKSNKFNFEFIINKSSKDDFKSDYISFKVNGSPIRNFDFQLSSSIIEKSPNFNFKLFRSGFKDYNWFNDELNDEKNI